MSDNIYKPQVPLRKNGMYIYPMTSADQIVLSDGSRLEKNGSIQVSKVQSCSEADHASDADTLGGKQASEFVSMDNFEQLAAQLSPLPTPTVNDSGKFLRVGANGTYVIEAIASAEGASF